MQQRYDVVLVDWNMPGLGGSGTLRRILALPSIDAPATIFTAPVDDPSLREAAAAQADAILFKPVVRKALCQTLLRVLDPAGPQPFQRDTKSPAENPLQLLRQHHAGQRVLVVEDNPVNQEVARALLERAGLIVEIASDGADGVALATARHYDLIAMDVQMPRVDGLIATRMIRGRGVIHTPILAMTANVFEEDRLACIEAGMDDLIAKPVDATKLYTTLLAWLPDRQVGRNRPHA
jgi:CheY-like chemotaxis protein